MILRRPLALILPVVLVAAVAGAFIAMRSAPDGQIPKGPPPGTDGTIPPSFDRAVVVIVGQNTIFVSAGYSQDLPIQDPCLSVIPG